MPFALALTPSKLKVSIARPEERDPATSVKPPDKSRGGGKACCQRLPFNWPHYKYARYHWDSGTVRSIHSRALCYVILLPSVTLSMTGFVSCTCACELLSKWDLNKKSLDLLLGIGSPRVSSLQLDLLFMKQVFVYKRLLQ